MLERAYAEVARSAGRWRAGRRSFPKGGSPPTARSIRFAAASSASSTRTPVPVVPMALRGLWGSMFSRKDGPAFKKLPRKLFALIELNVGAPIPAQTLTPEGLQETVGRLRGDRR